MAIERGLFLEVLKDAYSAYYTIAPEVREIDLPLSFRAVYGSRDEQFFFVKSASIWRNEKNEFVYVFSAPHIDAATAEKCIDWAWADMLPRVQPHKEHQYTNAKIIFVVDTLDDATAEVVRKAKRSKSYGPLSLHGYSELITAAVDLSRQKTVPNRAGNDLPKFFGKLFALRQEKA